MIRVVVVDDHLFYRKGIRSLLDDHDNVEIVGEAADGPEALACVAACEPDVVLLDIRMPALDGIAVCSRLVRDHPRTAIVMVTMLDDADTIADALRAGATGYVLKDASVDELTRAIHAAHARQGIFSPTVSTAITAMLNAAPRSAPNGMTQREVQILRCILEGAANEQIARRLGITTKTVRNNLSTIYNKIHVTDRSQAALWARANLTDQV